MLESFGGGVTIRFRSLLRDRAADDLLQVGRGSKPEQAHLFTLGAAHDQDVLRVEIVVADTAAGERLEGVSDLREEAQHSVRRGTNTF